MTETMCATTGAGVAKYLTLSWVIGPPPASCPSRVEPAIAGTALSAISAAGTSQPALRFRPDAPLRASVGRCVDSVMRRSWPPRGRRFIGGTA
ncbi:hypothetical protein [Microbispora bryophytorum]|uniref:hypothetical protein n=1 Tax=Microbispora bryophytorum TaxID=1460882 RepID=UPI0033CC426D